MLAVFISTDYMASFIIRNRLRGTPSGPVVQTPHSKAGGQFRSLARELDRTCQAKGHSQQLETGMLQLRPGAATEILKKREID